MAEERFQSAVTGLGDEKEGVQVGAAILLRTFLRPGYEQFYAQTFDLAVANLRRRGVSKVAQHQLWNASQNPDIALPLTTLDHALIVVFKEAFPLARDQEKREPRSLDATDVQLDNAYLGGADLKQMWGPRASLRKADLDMANLSYANLFGARLSDASLFEAKLSDVILVCANLRGASLRGANLTGAKLNMADLTEADLTEADLTNASLDEASFRRGNLSGANLNRTNLSGAKGLTKEQRAIYKAQGALVDEEPASNVSQEPVSTSPLLEPESVQPTSPQETSLTPDASQNNGMSSQPAPDQGTPGEVEKEDDVGRAP